MLVLDEKESLFLSAASIGFDSTTKRRLRLPTEIIDQHCALEEKGFLSLTGDNRVIFEPFFSVREFGLYDRIDVLGIRYESTTYAILLVALEEDETATLTAGKRSLDPDYGFRLFTHYSAKLKGLAPPPYYSDPEQAYKNLELTLSRYHESGRFIHMYTLALKPLLEAVRPDSATVDEFRFTEDVFKMLFSFVSATGIFYSKSDDEIIIGFATAAATDGKFIAHHLKLSISDFFPDTTLPEKAINYWKSIAPEDSFDNPLFD